MFDIAMKKVHNYVSGRILETKVAGKIAASLCRSLCKVRPEKALKVFLAGSIATCQRLLGEGKLDLDNLDNELKFNLQILSEVRNLSHLAHFFP